MPFIQNFCREDSTYPCPCRSDRFYPDVSEQVTGPRGFSERTMQPARLKCHHVAYYFFQPVIGNTRGIRVDRVASSFQKLFRSFTSHSDRVTRYTHAGTKLLQWYLAYALPDVSAKFS